MLQEYFYSQALAQIYKSTLSWQEDPISLTSKLKIITAGISGSIFLSTFLILLPETLFFFPCAAKSSYQMKSASYPEAVPTNTRPHFRWCLQSTLIYCPYTFLGKHVEILSDAYAYVRQLDVFLITENGCFFTVRVIHANLCSPHIW